MQRWLSGLRHTLGKRARLTASAGSNPVLSARRWLGISHKTKDTTSSYPFCFTRCYKLPVDKVVITM